MIDLNNQQCMNLQNIALVTLGAKLIGHSSSSDQHNYPPSNVLSEQEEEIWNSAQGLPQFITISLEDVTLKYSQIARLGFYCWHDYTTNPKSIDVEVALSQSDKMVSWCRLSLKHQSGRQFFSIHPLPSSYRIIKFSITETFGDYETYLNQIYIEAQLQDSQLNSMMGLADLESPLRKSQNKLKHYKDAKYINDYRQNQQYNHKEQSQEEEEHHYVENTFQNKQNYSASKVSYSKNSSKYSEQQQEEDEPHDKSYQNDIALLTLSKNVMEMEENVENIKRSLEVLNMRIDVTYQKLQEKMMERVDQIIDRKLQKFRQEIRAQMKRSSQLRESRSQNQRLDHMKSKEMRRGDYQEDDGSRGESRNTALVRQAKQSLHIHNLKSNRIDKQSPQEAVHKIRTQSDPSLLELMGKLANKLKEREVKVKKIESKRQKQKVSFGSKSGNFREQPYS